MFRGLHNLLKAVIAGALILAAQPGLMAMPGSQMAIAGHAMVAHGTMNHESADGSCMAKNNGRAMPAGCIGICAGMFACYGVTALAAADLPPLPPAAAPYRAEHPDRHATGLTRPPENPPPIA